MDPAVRHISESEFNANLDQRLLELARAIAFSGLSISEIAKGTRLKWDTVYAASQGQAVRMCNAERIRYFLKVHHQKQFPNAEGTKNDFPRQTDAEQGAN